jgi:uncharacterized membrane protein YsdA (DUF1294 family)/cold shock CspA family protein
MPENSRLVLTGKIVEWDEQKGYGFIQAGSSRIFLHCRDFSQKHKRPTAGDDISFTLGKDSKGRSCAVNAIHLNDGGKFTVLATLLLMALLVLPVMALRHHAVDLCWIGLYALLLSLVGYGLYASDKRRALAKAWRISENTLHLIALLGGWPGAFLAQRQLRHKVSKPSFQIVFWLIVLAYQFAAFDSLQNWQYSKRVLNHLQKTERHDPQPPF